MDFATRIKLTVYRMIADSGQVPDARQVAADLGVTPAEVRAGFEDLRAQRLLVLEPDDPGRIRMAPPFSAIPTGFVVHARGRSYSANCGWDAYGVAAALPSDAHIDAFDGHTGEPLALEVKDGHPVPAEAIAHFAVPAAKWWEDIVFT